jgi:uncharacterized membrane protein YgcG
VSFCFVIIVIFDVLFACSSVVYTPILLLRRHWSCTGLTTMQVSFLSGIIVILACSICSNDAHTLSHTLTHTHTHCTAAYRFVVFATNGSGAGASSSLTTAVTPRSGAPKAPTIVADGSSGGSGGAGGGGGGAGGGGGSATVIFDVGDVNAQSALTYTAVSVPQGAFAQAGASPIGA